MEKRKAKSISYVITCIIMLVFGMFLVSMVVIDGIAIRIDRRNNIAAIQQSMQQMTDDIEQQLDTINHYLYTIYQDNTDYKALTQSLPTASAYSHAADLNAVIGRYQGINQELDGYFLMYGKDSDVIGKMNYEKIPTQHQEVIRQQVAGLRNSNMAFEDFVSQIDGAYYYISEYQSGRVCVVAVINLNKYAKEAEAQMFFDGQGSICCPGTAPDEAFVSEWNRTDGEKRHQVIAESGSQTVFGQKVEGVDFWMLYSVENTRLNRFSMVTDILIFMTVALVISMVILIYITVIKMSRPMYQLVDLMCQVKEDETQEIKDLHFPYYEMQMMNSTLKEMVSEIRHQKAVFYEEKLSRQTAELQFLQTQLKPHFYLNCLKALNAQAYDAGMEEMQELILLISDYLRYCLGSVKNQVMLCEELHMTETYVELQKRFSNREFLYSVSVDKELESYIVPTFCVLSFVENSIKYAQNGLEKQALNIRVIIKKLTIEQDEKLDIVVMDSGQGYKEELLSEYNRRNDYSSTGIGINNMKRRCDVLYGEEASYMFYNVNGAVSELLLPLNVKTSADEDKFVIS